MKPMIVASEADWQSVLREHAAVKVYLDRAEKADAMLQGPDDKAIWFETTNFGWLLSAKDTNGKRRILAKF